MNGIFVLLAKTFTQLWTQAAKVSEINIFDALRSFGWDKGRQQEEFICLHVNPSIIMNGRMDNTKHKQLRIHSFYQQLQMIRLRKAIKSARTMKISATQLAFSIVSSRFRLFVRKK